MNWLNVAHFTIIISGTKGLWRQTNLRKETQFLNAVCSHAPSRVAKDKSIHSRFNEGIIIRRRCTGKRTDWNAERSLVLVADILVFVAHPAARQSLSLFQKRRIQSRGWTSPPTPILWGRERPATKTITDDGNSPIICRAYDERNEKRVQKREICGHSIRGKTKFMFIPLPQGLQ